MNYQRLFLLTIKQYLKRPFFLLILFLIPVLAFILPRKNESTSPQILVGFYMEGSSDDLNWLALQLEEKDSLYTFVSFDSEEELADAVTKGELECGYIIPANLFDQLMKNKKKNLVTLITSPKTTMAPIIDETFYASVFERLSEKVITRYLIEDSAIAPQYRETFDETNIHELFNYYLTTGSTFSFQYTKAPTGYTPTTRDILLSPVRGILSILILLAGFCGTLAYYRNQNNPIYCNLKVRFINISVPVLFATLISLSSILLSDYQQGICKESLAILIYGFVCIVFLFILSLIIKNREIFSVLLPAFLISCLIFSPVFFDITTLIPICKPVSYLFLPTYYLNFF